MVCILTELNDGTRLHLTSFGHPFSSTENRSRVPPSSVVHPGGVKYILKRITFIPVSYKYWHKFYLCVNLSHVSDPSTHELIVVTKEVVSVRILCTEHIYGPILQGNACCLL